MKIVCAFFIMFLCDFVLVKSTTIVVDSPFGKIRGARKTHEKTGLPYLSFKGIPYAKPPVGDLRFAKPQPHPKLDDVFDASEDVIIRCPPPTFTTFDDTKFQEDCLVLYIVTPGILPVDGALRKVMVYIHGGGFIMGDAGSKDSKSFVTSQDVVYVAMNYRLGVLGFLSTENEASPGNYGLWDQTLALKWVKDNIRDFGGDPDDVTIAGESSGGRSVGYQVLSPHTKGLFTKAYMHSGTASAVFSRSIGAQSHVLTIAKIAGCWEKDGDDPGHLPLNDSIAIVDCLRQAPLSDIVAFKDFSLSKTQFVPVVDGDFIPDVVTKLLQDDDYLESVDFFDHSYLIALNNEEVGANENYFSQVKFMLSSNPQIPDAQKELMYQNILTQTRNFYMDTQLGAILSSDGDMTSKIDDFYQRRFQGDSVVTEMITDLNFLIPSFDYLAAASRRKSCSPYLLYFDYFPQYMKGGFKGTQHALDLVYWLDYGIDTYEKESNVGIQGPFTEEDDELKRTFSKVLGDFIKTGNPGLTLEKTLPSGWPKYDVRNSHYLNFNSKPWVSSFLEKDKQDLWFDTVPNNLMKQARVFSTGSSPKQYPSIFVLTISFCFAVTVTRRMVFWTMHQRMN